ncbi:MAG: hypothetical protein ACTSQJ_19650 [Promethearchaeota archaeon]
MIISLLERKIGQKSLKKYNIIFIEENMTIGLKNNKKKKFKEIFSDLPDSFLFLIAYFCALSLWPLDIYLYIELNTTFFVSKKIFFITSFIFFYIIIAIFSYFKRGNTFYIGLLVYIIAFFLIILPFFNIYLPLYDEAPWGNTSAAETFYLGCFLLVCGGFLLNFDIYVENKKIFINIRKLPEETKDKIMRAFLFVSGLFLAMNLWDYNGLIMPIYYGYEYAPEPLLLEKISVIFQFFINTIMLSIWLTILTIYLARKGILHEFKIKISIVFIILLIIVSAILIFTCKVIPLSYEEQRYIIQPIPAYLICFPLLIILQSEIKYK